ncbi:VOC family protein [Candidatus Micrarchaeota archaeon]|nr:VOC family protein [Candidatus Micrarchaeota archaeon]
MDSVVHFEVPTRDLNRAKKFYEAVFNWQLQDIPEMNYTIARTTEVDSNQMPLKSGAINGGMVKDDPVVGTVIVMDVQNIDDSIEKIKANGGTMLMEKTTVGDMGLYARAKDTEGNIIGVWQALKK